MPRCLPLGMPSSPLIHFRIGPITKRMSANSLFVAMRSSISSHLKPWQRIWWSELWRFGCVWATLTLKGVTQILWRSDGVLDLWVMIAIRDDCNQMDVKRIFAPIIVWLYVEIKANNFCVFRLRFSWINGKPYHRSQLSTSDSPIHPKYLKSSPSVDLCLNAALTVHKD